MAALIIDPSDLARRAASRMLESLGWFKIEGRTGSQAIRYLALAAPAVDLLLLDVDLPDTSWEWVVRRARDTHRRFPAILMSAGRFDVGGLSDDIRPDGYLAKPFGLATLRAELSRLV